MTLLPAALTPEQLRRLAFEEAKKIFGGESSDMPEILSDFALRFLAAVAERQEPEEWEGAEEWEPLAYELCAEEHGEECCNDLLWGGGPIPEPWGERWLKYESEAKRMIALVRKHVAHPAPQPTGWQPIETAPKDGTHILVRSLIGSEPPTVCHWFDGGWHLSVNRNGDDSEFQAAFWREI